MCQRGKIQIQYATYYYITDYIQSRDFHKTAIKLNFEGFIFVFFHLPTIIHAPTVIFVVLLL